MLYDVTQLARKRRRRRSWRATAAIKPRRRRRLAAAWRGETERDRGGSVTWRYQCDGGEHQLAAEAACGGVWLGGVKANQALAAAAAASRHRKWYRHGIAQRNVAARRRRGVVDGEWTWKRLALIANMAAIQLNINNSWRPAGWPAVLMLALSLCGLSPIWRGSWRISHQRRIVGIIWPSWQHGPSAHGGVASVKRHQRLAGASSA